jgi:nucleoside-diphosphate-sugar epimerase
MAGTTGTEPEVRRAAVELAAARLRPDDRAVLLGAGGWFGTTALHLLAGTLGPERLLPTTGRPRTVRAGGRDWALGNFDLERIRGFRPTVVVDLAFLTREKAESAGLGAYVLANSRLTSQFLRTASLPSVRAAVTVSSGAALGLGGHSGWDLDRNPYGFLKRAAESMAVEVAHEGAIGMTVARAWSLSGGFVTRPREYAFSDLILQAREGAIEVRSPRAVWRRYCLVEDFLAAALAEALSGQVQILDSGGPLVELGELAEAIAARMGTSVYARVSDADAGQDRYHSDDGAWREACTRLAFEPADLDEQIDLVAAALAGAR